MPQSMVLPFQQHPDAPQVKHLYHRLAAEGHQLLIVGGAVRDWLRGVEPKDLDLVTTATPDELEQIFPQTVPVGKAYGVMLVIQDQKSFEVATLRTEGRYLDGRHPEKVAWGTVDQDVRRRDFTINAIYYDPFQSLLYDLVGGVQDLHDHRIRSVGPSRLRFEEDHLRVLRAYRFKAQTNFFFDPELKDALREATPLLKDVSGERRREELTRLFEAPFRQEVLLDLEAARVLECLFPGLRFPLEKYQPWKAEKPVRLLEFFRWILCAQALDLRDWKACSESLKLSREDRRLLEEALCPWAAPDVLNELSLAQMTLRLWNAGFASGVAQYLFEISADQPLRARVEEAQALQKRWGSRPPEPWMRATDFPDLKGAELGAKLKAVYEQQIVSGAANRTEFLKWRMTRPEVEV